MRVVLPDSSELELPDGATGLDAARAIGPKLAEQAVLIRQNGNVQDLRLPLRESDPRVRYCGDFYGQDAQARPLPDAISIANLRRILNSLPEGVTELGCHPGYDDGLETPYRTERAEEVRVLCDHVMRAHLNALQITPVSFSKLR